MDLACHAKQRSLLDAEAIVHDRPPAPTVQPQRFDGPDDPADVDRDARLGRQNAEVFGLMKDGTWRTLEEIERRTGFPQASISARLRDLRKPRFGGYTVERRHIAHGLYEYRVTKE